MPELLYPTSQSYGGPWLLDLKSLETLDNIIDVEWGKIKKYKEQRINEEIQRESQALPAGEREEEKARIEERIRDSYRFRDEKREVIVAFRSGNKMAGSTFGEVSREPAATSEVPTGFILRLESGEVTAKVSMSEYSEDDLDFSVESPHPSVGKSLFFEIDRWAKSTMSPGWVRIARSAREILWYVFVFALFMSFVVSETGQEQYRKELTAQAHTMIEDGLDSTEAIRALEMLVSLETKYLPVDYPSRKLLSKTAITVLFVALFICIALSFLPKSYLGFGRGENRVKYWRLWLKFLSVTIPSSILVPLFFDKLRQLF